MRILARILLLLSAIVMLFSCDDEVSYTHDSSHRLSLSADSLLFEPLLTEQPTSTRRLMVWNRSGEDLMIEHIGLCGNGNFQINVNGQAGTSFRNIELLNGDSLYIFVRANIQKLEDAKAALVEDSILLKYNGNIDKIVLSAVSQNAIVLRKHTIEHDTVWTKEQPFLIFDTLTIAQGAKLTIKAGTAIFLHNKAGIVVDGTLDVQGNASDMVLMMGDRADNVLTDLPYTALPKQWGDLRFTANSTGNMLEGLFMTGSTTGITVDSAEVKANEWRLVIANCDLRTSNEGILTCTNTRLKAYNSIFANGGTKNVTLSGGEYLFNFCTIADLATYSSPFQSILTIGGNEGNPLTNTQFNNCIVSDNRRTSFSAETAENGGQWCDYAFSHSYVYKAELDSVHFSACVNEGELGFIADNRLRQYDYHPDSTSTALNLAHTAIIARYPECETDLDANPRPVVSDTLTCAGALIYVPATENEE